MSPDCQFCIRPEPHRIVHEGQHFFVMMGLGPLAEGYALLVSNDHVPCCGAIPELQVPEFMWLAERLRASQVEVFGSSLMFEHGRSGACLPEGEGEDFCYHAHMHFLPADIDLVGRVRSDHAVEILQGWPALMRRYAECGRPYLAMQAGDQVGYVEDPIGLPPRYLRTCLAQLLGAGYLEDWAAFPSYSVIRSGQEKLAPMLYGLVKGQNT